MVKAMLVDLDGTLVDTHAANLMAYRQALDETGIVYDQGLLSSAVGRLAWRPMLQHVLPQHPHVHELVAQRKREIYRDLSPQVPVNEELVGLLRLLKPSAAIALVTSASRGSVEPLLAAKGLAELFDLVVTSEDVTKQKPDPEPYFHAAQVLGLRPSECLVLEDSEVGLAAAHAFGAQVWKVEWHSHL